MAHKRLFLDDVRNPTDVKWVSLPLGPWDIVRSYAEFVKYIEENGVPNFFAIDHDLEDFHYAHNSDRKSLEMLERTGLSCVKHLCFICDQQGIDFPEFAVHSLNSDGKKNIESYIFSWRKSKKYESKGCPFDEPL